MRYTVTSELDPELFDELERERKLAGLSRSAGMRQAIEWWLSQRKEHGEERVGRAEGRHRQVMRRLDYIVGMIREQEHVASRPVVTQSGERPLNNPEDSPAVGYADDSGETSASQREQDVRLTRDEGEGPRRSALAEARKRARRRVE